MTAVVTCTITERGAALARRLPYQHRHGQLVATVGRLWGSVDGLVVVGAAGIAVRAIGPLLGAKATDPAVVSVDDHGRWAVALAGGHAGGANALAREVAALLGAEAVVTTATDGAGLVALDDLPGFCARGDVAGLTRRWLDGEPPAVEVDPGLGAWPLPAALAALGGQPADGSGHRIQVTDASVEPAPGEVILRPRSLVVGAGASTGAHPGRLRDLAAGVLAGAGLDAGAVATVATLDRKAGEAAVSALAEALGAGLRAFPAERLAGVPIPNPSPPVAAAVGTPSVAEAAAVLAAGPGGRLVVAKAKAADATVAVARRAVPEGRLTVVGTGPGDPRMRTPAATAAIRHADAVIGYGPYLDVVADLVGPAQAVVRYPIGAEADRCADALARAAGGQSVALVCSGDPGVYAMAGLTLELAAGYGDPPVEVIPGVTAALAAASVLGAPLGHDHAVISLSDRLTPWPVIARRLEAAAGADLVVCLYNPRSRRRTAQFDQALAILARGRPAGTPAAVVADAGRPTQRVVRTSLAGVEAATVDMASVVIVGASTTRWIGPRMVTPRGYRT